MIDVALKFLKIVSGRQARNRKNVPQVKTARKEFPVFVISTVK